MFPNTIDNIIVLFNFYNQIDSNLLVKLYCKDYNKLKIYVFKVYAFWLLYFRLLESNFESI